MTTEENQLQPISSASEIIQSLVLNGDLSKMNPDQKVEYYNQFCTSLGLNPLTQPFQIIKFQGKEKLYATKDCTEQLRRIYGVSITDISKEIINEIYIVTAKARDRTGRTDASTGAISIKGLGGEFLANALMKAETKAKRRVTLSICGLGILDDSETESISNSKIVEEFKSNGNSTEIKDYDATYLQGKTFTIPKEQNTHEQNNSEEISEDDLEFKL